MLDRRGREPGVEIVGALSRKVNVRPEVDGRREVIQGASGGERIEQQRRRHRGHNHRQHCRGQNPPGPAGVERQKRDPTARPEFAHELARDQKARDDKEHVDPHVTAGSQPGVRVVEHDQHDRDRA